MVLVVNNIIICWGRISAGWQTVIITFPVSANTSFMGFGNHCDCRNASISRTQFRAEFAWGNGQGYGTTFYIAIGY